MASIIRWIPIEPPRPPILPSHTFVISAPIAVTATLDTPDLVWVRVSSNFVLVIT